MSIKSIFIFSMILFVCVSYPTSGANREGLRVPSGVVNVKREKLQIEKGERLKSLRTKFQLSKEYPNTEIIGFYEKELSPLGWVLCHRDFKNEDRWVDYFKKRNEKEKNVVRQLEKYFVNNEKKEIISLRVQYLGSKKESTNNHVKWDLMSQYIDITHYKFVSRKYTDIMKFYAKIGLDCKNIP